MSTTIGPRRAVRVRLPAMRASDPTTSRFRPDIEGLRGLAVLLVVAFHAGVPGLTGGFVGVDVFFVISGYLITGLLWTELRTTGRVSLARFYARRVRRLLPLASLVLVFVSVASLLVYAPIDRLGVTGDVRSAATWWSNWHFAASSVQYMSDTDQSPVLHFWSLSVEEQYYVLWPLLLVLLWWTGRARRRPQPGQDAVDTTDVVARRFRIVLVLVVLASFAVSVATTSTSGPWAYFGTHTRAWELGAGGLLAVAGTVPIGALQARVAGVLGLALVVGSALLLDEATVFPGAAAAVPVAGTLLLLVAGATSSDGVPRLFGTRAMGYLGKVSYGWYLWHWPLLVFAGVLWTAPAVSGDTDAAPVHDPLPWAAAAAVAASFALAAASHHLVESPLRASRRLARMPRATLAGGAALVLVVVAVPAVVPAPRVADATFTAAELARARVDDGLPAGCFSDLPATDVAASCVFGDPAGSVTVALIGDSHAAHWFAAMEELARTRGWRLLFWAKAACGFADVPLYSTGLKREYTECATWRARVLDRLRSEPALTAVVVGRSYSYLSSLMQDGTVDASAAGRTRALALWGAGAERTFANLAATKAKIVVIRETPRPSRDVPTCLSGHKVKQCAFSRAGHTYIDAALTGAEQAASGAQTVTYLDMTDAICPGPTCTVVTQTGVIKYQDQHHLSGTFSRSLAPALGRLLVPAVETGDNAG